MFSTETSRFARSPGAVVKHQNGVPIKEGRFILMEYVEEHKEKGEPLYLYRIGSNENMPALNFAQLPRFFEKDPKRPQIVRKTSFEDLPLELKQNVISFLNAEDLLNACCVCKSWKRLIEDPNLWRNKFFQDIQQWKVIQNGTYQKKYTNWRFLQLLVPRTSSSPVQGEPEDWKKFYLEQYFENKKIYTISRIWFQKFGAASSTNSSRPRKILHIPVLGEGLETSGKGLIKQMMWSSKLPLKMTGLHPGIEGIGSGVEFTVNDLKFNFAAVYKGERHSVFSAKAKWQQFFKKASAIILVVDTSEEILKKTKEELSQYFTEGWFEVPLLVLVCGNSNPLNPLQIAKSLGLTHVKDKQWYIRCAEDAMDGISEIVGWIAENLSY